ncbi:MBL fold metallo-hydrolase [Tenacibaculum ovolyticum]|uniref:MBL fold metallo-hydrolase n=1 Tax=Tenacibaculum ovolyticum TaxID=104270 RepID=UPI001F1B3381|nr:MBL fold metallo-hydrolase [Tenacibaculum ovolyticum]
MDFSIDMMDLGNADCNIIWTKDQNQDYLTIIDGGNPNDAKKIITHYEKHIKPNIKENTPILIINTHPHKDHIGGLVELAHYFKNRIARFYYNDPSKYINEDKASGIKTLNESIFYSNVKVKRIMESLKDVDSLKEVLDKYNIQPLEAFSDSILDHNLFEIVGPSKEFYLEQLEHFTNVERLKFMSLNTLKETEINEVDEGLKPCAILDEKNDSSAENLTSVLTKFTDSKGRKYLFTSDAGIDSFESAVENGYDIKDLHMCQLPHHGSRRNISTNWVSNFNPKQFWISANGSSKHPRKAVISCIKKNLPNCGIYSTHKGGTKHINSISGLFPQRNWTTAKPL